MALKRYAQLHPEKFFKGFLIFMLVINLLQALLTGILFDEAYYWYFSQSMDWGYFDHPPMMALLIKIGTVFSQEELGVRLLAPFLYIGTVFLIWKMIDSPKKNAYVWLFAILILATPLFTAYGFFLLPDTPLLFFSALFLFAYKQFLNKQSAINILLMAIAMAAMMYSKYHAVLLILGIMLSNLNLLRNNYFWVSGITALLLFSPHLKWLYDTDFVTLEYHIGARAKPDFKIERPLTYLLTQVGIYGSIFVYFYWAFFKLKNSSLFIKGCKYGIATFLIVFLISSYNRNTQAQWTIAAVVPFLIITFHFLVEHARLHKWFFRLAAINIVLIFIMRTFLADERIPDGIVNSINHTLNLENKIPLLKFETFGNEEWAEELRQKSGGIPVVFENSYRDASMYRFYTGIPTYSINNLHYRKNQFDIDSSEFSMQHKKIAFTSGFRRKSYDFTVSSKFKALRYYSTILDNFRSARKLTCVLSEEEIDLQREGPVPFVLYNPYEESIALKDLKFHGVYTQKNQKILEQFPFAPIELTDNPKMVVKSKDSILLHFNISRKPKTNAAKSFRIAIAEYGHVVGFQGTPVPLKYGIAE